MTNPHTLAIDIGGTGLKAAVLDAEGHMLDKRVRVHTPGDPTPEAVVEALAHLIARLPEFDRISIGFPGVVRRGIVLTAPNLGTVMDRRSDTLRALPASLSVSARS